jgi:hypothetical protein
MAYEVPALVAGAGPRPIQTREDVLAFFPRWMTESEDAAPVRDMLADALLGFALEWQVYSEGGIAQADYLRAVGSYLSELGIDQGFAQQPNEDDEVYRARLFQSTQVCTENAITVGVNAILAPFTDVECQLSDSALDRWFLNDGTDGDAGEPLWNSYLGANPDYPDRLYEEAAVQNDGYFRANSNPEGARLYGDTLGRMFLLLVPDLASVVDSPYGAFLVDDGDELEREVSFWLGDGSGPEQSYLLASDQGAVAIYRAIESFVDGVIGQSVRWVMSSELAA